jgi:hypothetical protein
MKNYVVLLLLALSSYLSGQNNESIKIKTLKQMAFNLPFSEETPNKIVSIPENNNEIVAASAYFIGTTRTKLEYVKVEKDTFLFVSYDSLSNHVIEKGYVFASDESLSIDTTMVETPITNKMNIVVINHTKPYKHGFWTINKGNISLKGYYSSNKKTGIWIYENFKKEDYREQLYDNDSLIHEKQLNLAISKDIDSTQKWLIGKWDVADNVIYNNTDFNGYEKNKRQTTGFRNNAQTNIYRYENGDMLEFCPNSVIKMYSKTFDTQTRKYTFSEPQLGTWTINADFLIEVQTVDSKKVVYKPLYIKDDNFRLEKLIMN